MLGATLSLHGGWRLRGDPTLHHGGWCKVSADEGDLDASATAGKKGGRTGGAGSALMTAPDPLAYRALDNFAAKMALLPAVCRYGRLTRATGPVLRYWSPASAATCIIERRDGPENQRGGIGSRRKF